MRDQKLSLATIAGGAVQEKVDRALAKVAENILDPNTDPKAARSITLKLTLKPDKDDREDVSVSATVSVSLASENGAQTQIYVNKDLHSGYISVMEHRRGELMGQINFDDLGMAIDDGGRALEEEAGEREKVLDLRKVHNE